MIDAQLAKILTSIMDILESMNPDDAEHLDVEHARVGNSKIGSVRELIAAASTAKEPRMTDSQLTAILTSIADILAALNARAQAGAFADDHGQADAIAKARELIVAASTTKPLPFGSGSVNV